MKGDTLTDDTQAPRHTAAASPRAFAQGTGLLLQVVGCVLFLSTGCVCLTSGLWDPALSRGKVLSQLEQQKQSQLDPGASADEPTPGAAKTGVMLMVLCTAVGGVAMAGFGLGLQSDQPRAAWGALGTHLMLSCALFIAGVQLERGGASVWVQLGNALLLGLILILTGFCVVALRQVRAHPPPPDLGILPADFIIHDPWRGLEKNDDDQTAH